MGERIIIPSSEEMKSNNLLINAYIGFLLYIELVYSSDFASMTDLRFSTSNIILSSCFHRFLNTI